MSIFKSCNVFFFVFSLFFFFNVIQKVESGMYVEKCLRWREKLKVSCGYIYTDYNYAQVNWNFKNDRILKSIDEFCPSCNLKNELFLFELYEEKVYKISYDVNKIYIKNTYTEEIFETEQEFSCFDCFLSLYKK